MYVQSIQYWAAVCAVSCAVLSPGQMIDMEAKMQFGKIVELCATVGTESQCSSGVMAIFRNVDRQVCAIECKLRKTCRFINYQFRMSICYLIRKEEHNETVSIVKIPGYAFGDKNNWDMTQYEKCNICSKSEVCAADTGMCQVEECRSPFHKPNSYAVGNEYNVGKKILFRCEQYHTLMVYSANIAKCLSDGTWTQLNYTCEEIDECSSNPCQNGGLCNDMLGGYVCSCVPGWTGINCETEINECDSDPCQNEGQCNDEFNGYTCTCAPGWTGNNCQTDIDECASSPCRNEGQCNDNVNGYTCNCASGWTGNNCQTDTDECASSPCQNGGQCTDIFNGYTCTCVAGWTGNNCQTDTDECASGPCQNGGQCNDNVNGYTCTCASGWTGNNCQTGINECASSPCLNGGQCNDNVNGYMCTCASGWTGNNCQTDTDECASDPCQNGGQCNDNVNGYTCTCASGWTGKNCQTGINECASSPCQNGGQCNDNVNGYTCTCASGWTGNNCQTALQCSLGWSNFQSSCYRLEAYRKKNSNAKTVCAGYGGHLADVTSQAEMDFLESLYLQSHSTGAVDGIWISSNDKDKEDTWVLSDGSSMSYFNWHPGQPDKEVDTDDCLQVWPNSNFKWNDVYCDYGYWFYCEKEL